MPAHCESSMQSLRTDLHGAERIPARPLASRRPRGLCTPDDSPDIRNDKERSSYETTISRAGPGRYAPFSVWQGNDGSGAAWLFLLLAVMEETTCLIFRRDRHI